MHTDSKKKKMQTREMMRILYIESKQAKYKIKIKYQKPERNQPYLAIPAHNQAKPPYMGLIYHNHPKPPYIALKPPYIGGYTGYS